MYLGRDSMEIGEHHIWLAGKGEYGKWEEDERYLMVRNEMGTMEFPHLTVKGVYKRYAQLHQYVVKKELPPEDYFHQWSNEQILAYAKAGPSYGKFNATDTKKVLKKLKEDRRRSARRTARHSRRATGSATTAPGRRAARTA